MKPQCLQTWLETELSRLSDTHEVPGVSVALSSGGHSVEATCGVLNTRTRIAVTPDSLFQIQSITKIFTTALVMQLVDEGLVQLDQPIGTYLPEFRTTDPAASEKVTVRHLLTHTGGFEGDLWQPTTSGPDALDRFVRDLVALAPQHSRPGQRFSYCNAGFGTLGRLVEVLRGTTYEQALRHHLAEPLGIDELAFSADQALAFRTAIGHVRPTPSGPLIPARHWALMPPSNPAAGNQLAMSARGLVRLGNLFLSGASANGVRILSEPSVALTLQPQVRHRQSSVAPTHQGLGWHLPQPEVAEHGGGCPGVATMLLIVPDQNLAAVVLTNADTGAKVARHLLDLVLTELAGMPAAASLPTPGVEVRVADPRPFLGRYSTRQSLLEVTRDGEGRLWLTNEPRNESVTMARLAGATPVTARHEIRPLGPDLFVLIGADGHATSSITFLEQDQERHFSALMTSRVAPRVE